MRVRNVLALATMLCGVVTPLAAQQAATSTRAEVGSPVPARSHTPTGLGPRVAPQFQRFEPGLAPSHAEKSAAVAREGGQHVIVISTLALVLGIILIVVLISN